MHLLRYNNHKNEWHWSDHRARSSLKQWSRQIRHWPVLYLSHNLHRPCSWHPLKRHKSSRLIAYFLWRISGRGHYKHQKAKSPRKESRTDKRRGQCSSGHNAFGVLIRWQISDREGQTLDRPMYHHSPLKPKCNLMSLAWCRWIIHRLLDPVIPQHFGRVTEREFSRYLDKGFPSFHTPVVTLRHVRGALPEKSESALRSHPGRRCFSDYLISSTCINTEEKIKSLCSSGCDIFNIETLLCYHTVIQEYLRKKRNLSLQAFYNAAQSLHKPDKLGTELLVQ